MVKFVDVEEVLYSGHAITDKSVIVSFETEYNGIWQCRWEYNGMRQLDNEPMFSMLLKEEQDYISNVGPFVFRCTFGEWPETFK